MVLILFTDRSVGASFFGPPCIYGCNRIPVVKDSTVCVFVSVGFCSCSKRSIEYLLTRNGCGNAVVVLVGGANEALDARPGSLTLTLKQRKGFVRIAVQHG